MKSVTIYAKVDSFWIKCKFPSLYGVFGDVLLDISIWIFLFKFTSESTLNQHLHSSYLRIYKQVRWRQFMKIGRIHCSIAKQTQLLMSLISLS